MRDGVISQPEAAEVFIIRVEYDIIFAFGDEEAIICERFGGREIEDEHEVSAHVCQDLISVVVPDFPNGQLFKVGLTLHDG